MTFESWDDTPEVFDGSSGVGSAREWTRPGIVRCPQTRHP
jgi:hypothetical protein